MPEGATAEHQTKAAQEQALRRASSRFDARGHGALATRAYLAGSNDAALR